MPENAVEFRSNLNKTEPRETVDLLKRDIDRSKEIVRMCSMCKKIAVSDDYWTEVEDAIRTLELFEEYPLPRLSHGTCPACYEQVLGMLTA